MKKIGYLLLLALSVMGAIGGIGYVCYYRCGRADLLGMAKNQGVFHQTDFVRLWIGYQASQT